LLADLPRLQVELERLTRGLQERLQVLGFNVDLVSQVPQVVDNLQDYADDLIGPLQSLAVASMGVFGNILILFMLSLYFAIDRPSIAQFMNRLVPPAYATEAQLLETSVTRSFGGFLRGQLVMGVAYGAVASLAVVLFGLPYGAAAAVTSGFLHAIPFFGPFISWAPPVLIALLTGGPVVPVLIVMAVGWLLTMNVLQPRLMADAVGIHPIIVLASVVIGTKIAGIPGAIFGIPIAAVLSAFFFHWYGRSRDSGTVADRAARRVEEREGRPVRRPREPVAGVDEDVVEPGVAGTSPGRAGLAEGDRA
jgi:predicted PurR-regulated permease PerM